MYPFSHSVTPAIRSHLEAQMSFFNDMSKSVTRSLQSLCELNMQLGQTLLEESTIASHQLLTTHNATDALAIASSRAQPAADKLRAYQQHLSRVVADAQIDMAQVSEEHAPVTSRTARQLADQVAKEASEETEKVHLKQQETMKNFRDPFESRGARGNGSVGAHGSMQSASASDAADGNRSGGSFQGGEPGSHAGQASGSKNSVKPG